MKINQFIELFRFISAYYFFRHGLPNLLLMHFSGLKFKEIISLEWFPPCMLIAISLIYPLFRASFICPLSSLHTDRKAAGYFFRKSAAYFDEVFIPSRSSAP